MKKYTNNKGGRRHFHVILFILFISSILLAVQPQLTSFSIKNQSPQTSSDSTNTSSNLIEYRTPEQIEVDKLTDLVSLISTIKS